VIIINGEGIRPELRIKSFLQKGSK